MGTSIPRAWPTLKIARWFQKFGNILKLGNSDKLPGPSSKTTGIYRRQNETTVHKPDSLVLLQKRDHWLFKAARG